MATLSSVIRERKQGLKRLAKASLSLDAEQEKVEREIKRILVRKRAVPEAADMSRILGLISGVSVALDAMYATTNDLYQMFTRS